MSMRIIECSSSNRNSASARASSVLPTPVGPRKMKLPSGRFGSCRPARARRMALATALIASSWPTTRWCRRSSILSSFWISPSISRLTGMPVHSPDDLGDVFLVDLFLEQARLVVALVGLLLADPLLEGGDGRVLQLGRLGIVADSLGVLEGAPGVLELLLQFAGALDGVLLPLPVRLEARSAPP